MTAHIMSISQVGQPSGSERELPNLESAAVQCGAGQEPKRCGVEPDGWERNEGVDLHPTDWLLVGTGPDQNVPFLAFYNFSIEFLGGFLIWTKPRPSLCSVLQFVSSLG